MARISVITLAVGRHLAKTMYQKLADLCFDVGYLSKQSFKINLLLHHHAVHTYCEVGVMYIPLIPDVSLLIIIYGITPFVSLTLT